MIYANEYVVNTFLTLTTKTYPYTTEDELMDEMIKMKVFPSDIQKDAHGNYFYKIGESKTMFTSHLDTASRDQKTVTHIFEKNMVKTNGDTILGADDKAGVAIMLYMIKNKVPGLYYFFIGEEVGCVGSGLASKYINFKGYDRCISFDRRGTNSVITHQSSSRCCSNEFAEQLASELNKQPGMKYETDDTGVYTDSAEFTSEIPECTNLSVGYYKEHTIDESQDIQHLSYLAEACIKVNWESLVTKRDPSKVEYKSWSYGSYGGGYGYNKGYKRGGNDWRNRDDYGYGWGSYEKKSNDELKKAYGYYDDFYDEDDDFKKTRRSGKKHKGNKGNARTFYSTGSELVPIGDDIKVSSNSKYEWIKFKFLEGGITRQELVIIRDQYLDMDNEDERKFYEIIESYVL